VLTSAVCDASKRSLVVLYTVPGQVPGSVAERRDQGLDEVSTAILGDAVGENVELTGFCLKALANDKALGLGKATELEISRTGKIPCVVFCYVLFDLINN